MRCECRRIGRVSRQGQIEKTSAGKCVTQTLGNFEARSSGGDVKKQGGANNKHVAHRFVRCDIGLHEMDGKSLFLRGYSGLMQSRRGRVDESHVEPQRGKRKCMAALTAGNVKGHAPRHIDQGSDEFGVGLVAVRPNSSAVNLFIVAAGKLDHS